MNGNMEESMKKTLIMTLALSVLFLLIGCDNPDEKALSGTVTITGNPILGRILSANTKDVTGVNGILSYQWKIANDENAAGTDIIGETDSTYVPVAADIGKYITVTIGNTGNSSSLTSGPVGPVVTATPTGGLAVTWTSDNTDYPIQNYPSNAINQSLKRVRVLDNIEGNFRFNLTASVTKSGVTYSKSFPVLAREKNYYGYLLAYFTGDDASGEQVRYALSTNGLDFSVLNNNNPVISSSISRAGGLRDPFVVRGHDGVFRMVNNDMRSSLGWGSNRGIVMSKSTNLINWRFTSPLPAPVITLRKKCTTVGLTMILPILQTRLRYYTRIPKKQP